MAFDITKALGDISRKPDGQKQIQYIPLHLIDTNPKNKYSTNGIESLAANIQTFGLLDPLIVKETPERRYMLISGHRRRLALRMNAEAAENYPDSMHEPVPCIVEPEDAPMPGIEDPEKAAAARPLAEELKLIYANADTRVMSSADTAQQVRRIRELFTGLQDLGYQFPGKMRDHIAAAAKVSATRVARLDVIEKGLKEPSLRKAWKEGTLGETSAYEIARRPKDVQKLVAQRLDAKILGGMTTERVAQVLDACEADGNRDREAREDWNKNVGAMAEAAGNVKSDFSAEEYLAQMHEEDTILRELCRNNLRSIMKSLMSFKTDYDFSENFRQPNIDRMRKHDPHGNYSCGWNANDGTGTWIDWDSKGIRVVTRGKEFRRSWTDFYDALTGAALQEAWKRQTKPKVSAADTAPTWGTGDPKEIGTYVIIAGYPPKETTNATMRTIRFWNGNVWCDEKTHTPFDLTVYRWFKLPEV